MYNGFISYSHSADGKLTPALASALEKFAKPWYKLRNLNIFRDGGSLPATPKLEENIEVALSKSEYLIYLASPDSAESPWVEKEIQYWLDNKPLDKLIIVLTEGDIEWDDKTNTFSTTKSDALPQLLKDEFNTEPFYVDLREPKANNKLTLSDPDFRQHILGMAAQLHGKEAKNLESEELKAHRTTMRLRNGVIAGLSVLFSLAVYFGVRAFLKQQEAQANYLYSEANKREQSDPTLALRLAEEAHKLQPNDSLIQEGFLSIYESNIFHKLKLKHNDKVRAVGFSENGDTLATGSQDSIVRLWEARKGYTLLDSVHVKGQVFTIDLHPNGRSVLIGTHDGRVLNWTLGNAPNTIYSIKKRVSAVKHSPDNRHALFGLQDNTVILWDLVENRLVRKLTAHNNGVAAVAFDKTGKQFLTAAKDGLALLWNLNDSVPIIEYRGHTDGVSAVAFSKDDEQSTILTGSWDKTARLWDKNSGKLIYIFEGHAEDVFSVDYSMDNSIVLTSSLDKTSRLWDLESGMQIVQLIGHTSKVFDSAFLPGGKQIITGSEDSYAMIWEYDQNPRVLDVPNFGPIYDIALDPTGNLTYTANRDGSIRVWDRTKRESKKESDTLIGHSKAVRAIAISPINPNLMISGSDDKTVVLWDLTTNSPLKEPLQFDYAISSITCHPEATFFAVSTSDGVIRVFDNSGELQFQLTTNSPYISDISYTAKGDKILIGTLDKGALVWDIENSRLKNIPGDFGRINAVCIVDEEEVVLGSASGTAYVVNLNSGRERLRLSGHDGVISDVAYANVVVKKGKRIIRTFSVIATASLDGSAQLWNMDGSPHGFLIREYTSFFPGIHAIGFSGDGVRLGTGFGNNKSLVWNVPSSLRNSYPFVPGRLNESPTRFEKLDELKALLSTGIIAPLTTQQKDTFNIK